MLCPVLSTTRWCAAHVAAVASTKAQDLTLERGSWDPYKDWKRGLLFEALIFLGFIGVVVAVALLTQWIFG